MPPCCDLSIILCTYNREEVLGRALDALLKQTLDPQRFEIVVVDNNSSDRTREVVQARASRHPHIRYLFEPRQGLPIARNSGVLAARASLVAFTDDDVEVQVDWAVALLAAFRAYPDVGYIGGKVIPAWDQVACPAWLPSTHYGPLALQDRGDLPFTVGSHDARPCLIGANFAVRCSVFERVGLFSPAFPWGEDREFQMRAWEAGIQGMYLPEIVAVCRVPPERVAKSHQRRWFSNAGRVHARMHLLERTDREGRLVATLRGRRLFRLPGYLLRELGREVGRWTRALISGRGREAFRAENQIRYLASYLAEHRRGSAPVDASSPPAIPMLPDDTAGRVRF
jgi:glycosyltransferase involved in cell wall biosynthesis